MKRIGKFDFPENPKEANEWKHYQRYRPLAMRVLAVAHTRIEGAWCAYIDAVPGMKHDLEVDMVMRRGDKVGEEIALAMFHEFKGIPYAG